MLQIPTWSRVLTALIVAAGIFFALPNALPGWFLAKMPGWVPTNTVSLGLDLQGGSYLLLEVGVDQVYKDKIESLVGDVRVAMRKARIGYTNLQGSADSVSFRVLDTGRYEDAKALLENLNPIVGGSLLTAGGRNYELTEPGSGTLV